MRRFRTLVLTATVSIVIAAPIYADGPCSPDPGIMNTPPCSMAQPVADDGGAPSNPGSSPTVEHTIEFALTDFALDIVENLLSLL